jgi:ADP-ribosylglycohydrolase
VPEAIIAFLDSTSYEDAVRNAISLGGDSDTLACITGGIAEAFYRDIPDSIRAKVRGLLTPDLLEIIDAFCEKYTQGSRTNGCT